MAKINRTTDNKCCKGSGAKGTLIVCWWILSGEATMEIIMKKSQKAKNKNGNMTQLYSLLAHAQRTAYPTLLPRHVIAALFTIGRKWKNLDALQLLSR